MGVHSSLTQKRGKDTQSRLTLVKFSVCLGAGPDDARKQSISNTVSWTRESHAVSISLAHIIRYLYVVLSRSVTPLRVACVRRLSFPFRHWIMDRFTYKSHIIGYINVTLNLGACLVLYFRLGFFFLDFRNTSLFILYISWSNVSRSFSMSLLLIV